jgi:hypothetical protein
LLVFPSVSNLNVWASIFHPIFQIHNLTFMYI